MTETLLPPGPRFPRPVQAVLWGLRYPQFTRAAHERFGATFSIRPGTMPPVVLTSDREAIQRLLTGDPLVRRHGNDAVRPLIGDRSVMLLEPTGHLARRKLLLPPFHGERVRVYADLMRRLMEREVARWRPGETVAVLPIAQNVTIEVILQAVLGVAEIDMRQRFRRLIDDLLLYPLGARRLRASGWLASRFTPPRQAREAAAFAAALPTPAVMTYFPELKERSWLNRGTRRWWRHRDRLLAARRADRGDADRSAARRARGHPRHARPGARRGRQRAVAEALRDDLITLIAAGHETTAAAIAWGRCCSPTTRTCANAQRPPRRTMTSSTSAPSSRRSCASVRRSRLPPAGCSRSRSDRRRTIPPRTRSSSTRGRSTTPGALSRAGALPPERFLDGAPESYAWLPFGGGAHRCLGAALAELEIKVALATILRSVTIRAADPDLPPPARRAVTLIPHGGGRIRIVEKARRA